MNDEQPTFVEKALVFIIVVCGTAAALFLTTHLVKAGLLFVGKCA